MNVDFSYLLFYTLLLDYVFQIFKYMKSLTLFMTDFESHGIEERQNSPLVRPTTTFFLISFFQYSMYFIRILSHVMFNIFYPVF